MTEEEEKKVTKRSYKKKETLAEAVNPDPEIKIEQGKPTKGRRGDIKSVYWDKITPEQKAAHFAKLKEINKERVKERKLMKEQMKTLLSLPVKDVKAAKALQGLGLDMSDIDNQMLMLVVMWQQVLRGRANCVPAFNSIVNILGEASNNMDVNANLNMVFNNDIPKTDEPKPVEPEEITDGKEHNKSE